MSWTRAQRTADPGGTRAAKLCSAGFLAFTEAQVRGQSQPMTDQHASPDTALVALIPTLTPLARRLGRNHADAEDLLQETLTALLGRLRAGGRIDNLPAYARIVLRNTALRRRRLPAAEPFDEASPLLAQPSGEGAFAAVEAITRLPEPQAQLLRAALQGHSPGDLARATGLAEGTVHSRLARARAQLRTDLDLE